MRRGVDIFISREMRSLFEIGVIKGRRIPSNNDRNGHVHCIELTCQVIRTVSRSTYYIHLTFTKLLRITHSQPYPFPESKIDHTHAQRKGYLAGENGR